MALRRANRRCLYTFCAIFFVVSSSLEDPSLVSTPNGPIQGTIFADKVAMFRSVPYAEPPVAQNRWNAPVPKQAWGANQTLYATTDPPGCPQKCNLPPNGCPITQSEDCLFLNVFKPIQSKNAPLPVAIWIHGGNFYQGYSGGALYNGTNMVLETGVIVVTINYRLGALGFLWSVTGPSGNYGLLDQMLAIEWVHDNIAYFGGDTKRITLFGQSAGAVSVALHMTHNYPVDLGLFHAAIMESEPFGLPLRDPLTWGTLPYNFYSLLGCDFDKLSHNEVMFWQCLRNKTMPEVVDAQMTAQNNIENEVDHFWNIFMPWTPTVGTSLVAEQPIWAFQKGLYADLPFIVGVVENEALSFIYSAFQSNLSETQLLVLMEVLIGHNDTRAVTEQYPLPPRTDTTDYRPYATLIVTDGLFRCPTWNITMQRSIENVHSNKSWLYHFDHVSSFNTEFWGPNYTFCDSFVCHASELPYVFHPNGAVDNVTYLPPENELAVLMQTFWSNLAQYNDPGTYHASLGSLTWPAFDASNGQLAMVFNAPGSNVVPNVDNDACSFWNQLDYNWIK